mmetsp:Transcript_30548/g.48024  ORF Transcript_30548/g.48024 Transcript_30548/m.48024 type:complete len:162 (-) Transcript_30548:225-710(-)
MLTELHVPSERIRFLANSKGEWEGAPKDEAPAVDEATGMGGWQSVAVRVYDQAEEDARLKREAVERVKREARAARAAQREAGGADGEDALETYDVYRTGRYKGVQINEEVDGDHDSQLKEQEEEVSDKYVKVETGSVAFKKKKKGPKGKFRRKKANDDEDD